MYDSSKQLLPRITPEMLRSMPDQVSDILNRLIQFYQQYQKDSTTAINANTNDINALNEALGSIVIPNVYNGQLTIQQNGTTVTTFTANQQNNTTANIETPVITMTTTDPGDGQPLEANHFIAVYEA